MDKEKKIRISVEDLEAVNLLARDLSNKTGKWITASEVIRLAIKKLLRDNGY